MQMRPLPSKGQGSPSLVATVVGLALSPVLYGIHIGTSLLGWVYANLLPAPIRLLTAALQLADGLICDMLALLTKEPGLKSQVCAAAAAGHDQCRLPGCCPGMQRQPQRNTVQCVSQAALHCHSGSYCDCFGICGVLLQIQACQETISSLQLTKQAQERQIAVSDTTCPLPQQSGLGWDWTA